MIPERDQVIFVGNIGFEKITSELFCGFTSRFFIDISDDYPGAVFFQKPGTGFADAHGGTGHDNRFIFQFHIFKSFIAQ